jgi:hypothetical protein
MSDVLEEIKDSDEAFLSTMQPKELAGVVLKPLSTMRQAIVNELTIDTRTKFFDAVITVWVCTLEPEDAMKALGDKNKARIAAFDWAEQHGVSVQNHKPLFDIYDRLNAELAQATNVRSDDDGDEHPKNAGGLPVS